MDAFISAMETQGWALQEVEHLVSQPLRVGDYAKLPFVVFVPYAPGAQASDRNWGVELMWVVVTKVTADGYVGELNSTPSAYRWNKDFDEGSIITFTQQNVIHVMASDAPKT